MRPPEGLGKTWSLGGSLKKMRGGGGGGGGSQLEKMHLR